MALLPILKIPDPLLQQRAAPVQYFGAQLRTLIGDMAETMYNASVIGLAAPQVSALLRLFIVDLSPTHDHLMVFVNPEIVESSELWEGEEGCLSIPETFTVVSRAAKIKVRAINHLGNPFTLEAENQLAACIQHELDHLNGKVFIEYLSQLKQNRIRSRLAKKLRANS